MQSAQLQVMVNCYLLTIILQAEAVEQLKAHLAVEMVATAVAEMVVLLQFRELTAQSILVVAEAAVATFAKAAMVLQAS